MKRNTVKEFHKVLQFFTGAFFLYAGNVRMSKISKKVILNAQWITLWFESLNNTVTKLNVQSTVRNAELQAQAMRGS